MESITEKDRENPAEANDAFVSVLMITYNQEAYIEEAIKGVLKQRKSLGRIGFGLELIIMDDCSSDTTPDIIERYRRQHPDVIKPVRNPRNLGIQGNYLAGFPRCRGRYMALCDADDYWFSPSKLSRQVKYMESHPECAITFHRMVNFYEDAGEMSLSNGGTPTLTDINDLSRANYITNASVVYRRALIDLNALPSWMHDITLPDYAMHMFYATKGNIRFFSTPMAVYRKAAGCTWSMGGALKRLQMAHDVRQRILEWLGDDYPEATERLLKSMDDIRKAMDVARSGISPAPPKKSLLSKTRAVLSKLVPRPRP